MKERKRRKAMLEEIGRGVISFLVLQAKSLLPSDQWKERGCSVTWMKRENKPSEYVNVNYDCKRAYDYTRIKLFMIRINVNIQSKF